MKKNHLLILVFLLIVLSVSRPEFVFDAEAKRTAAEPSKPELVLQTGHSKSVDALVFSPDNRWAASGSFDNSIKIWEVEKGRDTAGFDGS